MTEAATDHPPVITQSSVPADWWAAVRQYGFATALASSLVWYVGFYVVEPMRLDQQAFMRSVIDTNKTHADAAAQQAAVSMKQTEIQQQQAAALSNIVPLLQQIRDDQRRGVWNESKHDKAI